MVNPNPGSLSDLYDVRDKIIGKGAFGQVRLANFKAPSTHVSYLVEMREHSMHANILHHLCLLCSIYPFTLPQYFTPAEVTLPPSPTNHTHQCSLAPIRSLTRLLACRITSWLRLL